MDKNESMQGQNSRSVLKSCDTTDPQPNLKIRKIFPLVANYRIYQKQVVQRGLEHDHNYRNDIVHSAWSALQDHNYCRYFKYLPKIKHRKPRAKAIMRKTRLERVISKECLRQNRKVFQCLNCTFKTTSEAYLKRHFKLLHEKPPKKGYFCKKCCYKTRSPLFFEWHVLKHLTAPAIQMFGL